MVKHVVVTPVKNELEFLPNSIDSMVNQTVRPDEWILVDDSSEDGSREVMEEAANKYGWIKLECSALSNERSRGANISRLFTLGLSASDFEWDFCSKIDADIILPLNYFEKILREFAADDKLGIASGNCYVQSNKGKRKIEKVENHHTRGALKTYRKECFLHIGGVKEIDGWDGLDNMAAQFHGWKTRNFPEILARHMRATGFHEGMLSNCFGSGIKSHKLSYSWPYLFGKGVVQMGKWPYFIGGLSLIIGFFWAKISRVEKIEDREIAQFIKKKQRMDVLKRISFRRNDDY